jgi:hypothetical protein
MHEPGLLRSIAASLADHGDELNRTYIYLAERSSGGAERQVVNGIQRARDACWGASVEVAELAREVAP